MGKGIDLAREAPEHAAVLDDFKDQLLIVLLKRLQATDQSPVIIPVAEADDTGQDLVSFQIIGDPPAFHFFVSKKA